MSSILTCFRSKVSPLISRFLKYNWSEYKECLTRCTIKKSLSNANFCKITLVISKTLHGKRAIIIYPKLGDEIEWVKVP